MVVAALLVLTACNTSSGPASITSVSPTTATIGEDTRIVVQGHNLIAELNLRKPTIEVCGVTLGDVQAAEAEQRVVALAPGGTQSVLVTDELSAMLGGDLTPGLSDVTVTLPDGSTFTLPGAFECLLPEASAAIAASPTSGFAPLAVTFESTDSAAGSGSLQSFSWDFGDGTTGSGESATHIYTDPGEYSATLQVTDSAGAQAQATATITVLAVPPVPSISIIAAEQPPVTGESTEFTAVVHHLEDDAVTWSLTGSGSIADASANPVTFTAPAEPGSATLTVTSVADPSLTASIELEFDYPELTVSITPDVQAAYPLQEQVFTATVDGWHDDAVTWDVTGTPTTAVQVDGNELTFTVADEDMGQSFGIRATSTANPEQSDVVSFTVAPTPISLSPTSVTVKPGETVTFSLLVEGSDDPAASWSSDGGMLSANVGASVQFTAPHDLSGRTEFTVSVTSSRFPQGTSATVQLVSQLAGSRTAFFTMCPSELAVNHASGYWNLVGQDRNCNSNVAAFLLSKAATSTYGTYGNWSNVTNAVMLPGNNLLTAFNSRTDVCPGNGGFVLLHTGGMPGVPGCDAELSRGNVVDMRPVGESSVAMLIGDRVPGLDTMGTNIQVIRHTDAGLVTDHFVGISSSIEPGRLLVDNGLAWVAGKDIKTGEVSIRGYSYSSGTPSGALNVSAAGYTVDRITALARGSDSNEMLVALRVLDPETSEAHIVLQMLARLGGGAYWHLDLGPTGDLGATSIFMDPARNVFVAGQSQEPGEPSRAFLAKLSYEGQLLWREHIGLGTTNVAATTSLQPWGEDQLMVGGYAAPNAAPFETTGIAWTFNMD